MSMFLLPRMIKREKRSAIINVGSMVGYYNPGDVRLYAVTKRYNMALSTCMMDAYSHKIDVMTVTPSFV